MEAAGCEIENAKLSDTAEMFEFWRSTPGIGIGRGDTDQSLKLFIEKNPSTCLVIRDNGRLIGTVLGGFDGRRGYIYHLAVDPDYRGKGYGKALLKRVLQELEALGADKVHLFAFYENRAAAEFYLSQGCE